MRRVFLIIILAGLSFNTYSQSGFEPSGELDTMYALYLVSGYDTLAFTPSNTLQSVNGFVQREKYIFKGEGDRAAHMPPEWRILSKWDNNKKPLPKNLYIWDMRLLTDVREPVPVPAKEKNKIPAANKPVNEKQ